jgi:hypothetical protein
VNKVKVIISLLFIAAVIVALAVQSVAYPPFLEQTRKFGAKDCRFCHVKLAGGEPFNARGQWLVKEKERRKADAVDPEWLVDYKSKSAPKKKK